MIRIFYLASHKLLVQTELKELRNLGYEVFRPTYLSSIYDQSADYLPDPNPSSLSDGDLNILKNYNFFYNEVNSQLAQLIEDNFDIIIVTISPAWLKNFLKSTKLPIIYRTYGQPYNLSSELSNLNIPEIVKKRGNFYYSPHSKLALTDEHLWLTKKMHVIPYWVEALIYEYENKWNQNSVGEKIGLFCPNIQNPYYLEHYNYLNKYFPGSEYRIFGVQPNYIKDSRVVGTLERKEQIEQMLDLRAIIHTYPEPNTSYLFAVEGAIMGVPVISSQGNLFSKLLINNNGIFKDPIEVQKIIREMSRSSNFLDSVKIGQSRISPTYNRDEQINEFKTEYVRLINQIMDIKNHSKAKKLTPRLVVLFHFGDSLITFKNNEYLANQGIPRVVKYFAQSISKLDIDVVVTTTNANWQNTWGFFNDGDAVNNIETLIIDPEESKTLTDSKLITFAKKYLHFLRPSVKFRLKRAYFWVIFYSRKFRKLESFNLEKFLQPGDIILCPHYYAFPEVVHLEDDKKIILYLPDYVPHLYPEKFRKEILIGEKTGRLIAKKSDLIITNSQFTKSYLPQTKLGVESSKIRVFPLPILSNPSIKLDEFHEVADKKYLFYPTAVRPNKRIDVLLNAFDKVVEEYSNIYLVLTSNPNSETNASRVFQNMRHADRVLIFENVTDSQLKYLYLNCLAVVVSTESEGNFPTQLTEAITLGKPTLSASIEVITQEVGDDSLLHFESGNAESLHEQIKTLLENMTRETKRSRLVYTNYIENADSIARKALKQIIEEIIKD